MLDGGVGDRGEENHAGWRGGGRGGGLRGREPCWMEGEERGVGD